MGRAGRDLLEFVRVAHLALSKVRLGNLLGVAFERFTEAGTAVDMVVLRLADGPTVALAREAGSSRPGTGLLVRGVEPADAVLAAFLGATGIGRDQVTWVADDDVRRERARMTGPVGLRHGRAYDVDTGRIGVGHVSAPASGRPVEVELTVAPYQGDERDLTLHAGDRFRVGSASWRLVRVDGAGGYDYVVWIAPADEAT